MDPLHSRNAFEIQVTEQLQRIEAMLAQLLAAQPGVPAQPPTPAPPVVTPGKDAALQNAQQITQWLNALWQQGAEQRTILDGIRRRIASDINACVIGFRDHARALMDSSYAEFVRESDGRLFVLCCGQLDSGDMLFAALPYPVNDIWYDRGVTMLERLYRIAGARDFLCPHVQIGEAALLRATLPLDGTGWVYLPYRMGTMKVE
ncbi:MAG: hypothetical protein VB087_09545 [Candidatus Limiplasma sp.]|nr:hypothetical protein [Candidatus Limiplasma sp.]MEA5146684.1 hypothetical protein [Candidatus Limiplasma sp.]